MTTRSEEPTVRGLLTSASPLAGLPPEALKALVERLYPEHFPRGATIIRQGNTDKDLYLLGKGEVRVTAVDRDGRQVEVGRIHEGEVFGEWSLLTNRPRAATVTAESDVDAYILHKEDYAIVLESHLSLVQYLLSALSIRQREFAGLLAGELNLWASHYGGMKKDPILTVSFLSVAGVPTASLEELLPPSQFRLWMQSVVELGSRDVIEECLAVLDGREVRTGTGLGPAVGSVIRRLSTYPTFAFWREAWLERVREGLEALAEDSAHEITTAGPALEAAAMATFHMVFDPAADRSLVQRYVPLDDKAAAILGAAYVVHLRAAGLSRLRRPGYRPQDREIDGARRNVERRLGELDRMAKDFPRSSRMSAGAVAWVTRLLAEYHLRRDELRRRTVALPYSLD